MDFLVDIRVLWPPDGDRQELEVLVQKEAARVRELSRSGHLLRIWRVPGQWRNLSIWTAESATVLDSSLRSLPLFPWLEISVTALADHPSDPTNLERTRTE